MADQWLGFTVSVRTPTGKQEREGQASWQELPKDEYGHYLQTLWTPSTNELLRPDKEETPSVLKEGVFLFFFSQAEQNRLGPGETGVIIISRGNAEVYCRGDRKLLSRETPIVRRDGVILIPGQAYEPGGRAEIFFNQAGQSVELQIKIGERTVREVKIVNQE